MSTALSQAFCGVYSSSKEILKNNQRHLFCNMLDLLINTCKTAGIAVTSTISNDELVHYWLCDILPLVFDKELAVQTSAIAAVEQGLLKLEISCIHNSKPWPQFKSTLLNIYAPQVHKLRDERNKHWHEIWCLFIRILDREILKSASTINAFLSIVELGFRSCDTKTRIEAFQCWRLLIQIFAEHGEIFANKRIKLICIPLRSSQSKSALAAAVKLRVWWYLITCLKQRLGEYIECVVEPFLAFTFGSSNRSTLGAAQQYECVRELAIPCLMALLSAQPSNEFLNRLLRDYDLEVLGQPSVLIAPDFLRQHWQPIVNATLGAVRLLLQNDDPSESYQHILQFLLTEVVNSVLDLDDGHLTAHVCDQLIHMLPQHPRPIVFVLNIIAMKDLQLDQSLKDFQNLSLIMGSLVKLFVAARLIVPPAVLQRCINQVFSVTASHTGRNQWCAFRTVLDLLDQSSDGDDIEVKFIIWQKTSCAILDYLCDNSLDYRLREYANILNRWILWPLRYTIAHTRRAANPSFHTEFCVSWKKLLISGQNSPERQSFLIDVKRALQELVFVRSDEKCFPELLDAFVDAGMKVIFYQQETFELFNEVLSQPLPQQSMESCLNIFRNVLIDLQENKFAAFIDLIKKTCATVVRNARKGRIGANSFDDWKHAIAEKVHLFSNKSISAQINEIFKSDDEFVAIPSVWSLKPDKLTERQKERFAEKANIPALYNDMSQSQESSIKPWTPNKIVLDIRKQSKTIEEFPKESKGIEDHAKNLNVSNDLNLYAFDAQYASEMQNEEEILLDLDVVKGSKEVICKGDEAKDRKRSKYFNVSKEKKCPMEPCGPSGKHHLKKPAIEIKAIKATVEYLQNSMPLISAGAVDAVTGPLHLDNETSLPCSVSPTQQKETYQPHLYDQENDLSIILLNNNATLSKLENCNGDSETAALQISQQKETNEWNCQATQLKDNFKISQLREVSPKKTSLKFTPLSSPPDRKLTNNSSSPTLRPKPPAHLTGRGAQLINMIRNRKIENCSPQTTTQPVARCEKIDTGSALEQLILNESDNTSTPLQPKDLLVFSRRLPSPWASPSMSILKRKIRRDSIEDMALESPAHKRKRVSFHDPPVSVTKEYVKESDENNTKLKRCLNMDKVAIGSHISEAKHLKRQNKLDSLAQIENFVVNIDTIGEGTHTTEHCGSRTVENAAHDVNDNNKDAVPEPDFSDISFLDANATLNFVAQRFSLEDVMSKYFSLESTSTQKLAGVLAKFLSNYMSTNPKLKSDVLEILSEKHSKDFLDHAVQENLSSVVCDRLNLNSVIDYICAKSKINATCRTNLLLQLPDIFSHIRSTPERLECIKALLQSTNLNDISILELITILVRMRSGEEPKLGCVSESAVDSSSNL